MLPKDSGFRGVGLDCPCRGRDVRPGRGRREEPTVKETMSRARIYAVVRRIPKGRVATYGQVAALAGYPGHARQVGYALSALPSGTALPWHRVINARGEISLRHWPGAEVTQRMLL